MTDPGETVRYTVTYLEMEHRPTAPAPPRPANLNVALLRAEAPPVDYFLYLYDAVGRGHQWTDWFDRTRAEQEAFVSDPAVSLTTLMLDGWPGGFFMLDRRVAGTCDLAYFGLVPEAVGRGLGLWFLSSAIDAAWTEPGTGLVTVNTCTLDHPRALGLYQRAGFRPVRREEHSRVVTGRV